MRQLLTLILSVYVAFGSLKAQESLISYEIYFENQDYLGLIDLDSNSGWQIGSLQHKWGFGWAGPTGIMTDTTSPYKSYTNTQFIVKIPTASRDTTIGFFNERNLEFSFYYKMELDSVEDFGLINLSLDQGKSWRNIADIPEVSGTYPDTFNIDKSEWSGIRYNCNIRSM